jgi:serine/threonine-protein kinase
MIGSPLYMSPEQARAQKKLDGRADLWSLGVVLYEALTGQTPNHDKDTLGDLLVAICVDPTPPVQSRGPWIGPELAAVIERTLEKDPARRFQTAREMHAALVALAPSGTSLREDMLVAIAPEMRAHVAPKPHPAVWTGPGAIAAPAPAPLAAMPSSSGAQLAAGITNPDLGASTGGGEPRRTSPAYWALGAIPVLLIAAFFGVVLRGKRQSTVGAGMVQSEPSASASVAALSPVTSSAVAPPSATTPGARTVRVTIVAPPGATVEVDGTAATIEDGAISILGGPGSLHTVRVTHVGASRETDVTVLESGVAMPAKVELAPSQKGRPPAKPATVAAEKKPPPSGTPAATPPTAANPSEPAIKTTF